VFKLNPNLVIQTRSISDSQYNFIIIDDVLDNFEALLKYAKETAYFQPPGQDGTLYPGSRDDMPMPYYECFNTLLSQIFSQKYKHTIAKCWLSKITVKPEDLHVMQTMPHYDSLLVEDMAAVHYFNDNTLGGTNFYRYKKLNKLALEKSDEPNILQMLKEHKDALDASGYIHESNSIFEKVDSIEAKPNRIVIYPGNILHSPVVTDCISFDKNADNNRTSVNSFFKVFLK
jgi:hypothetical protein